MLLGEPNVVLSLGRQLVAKHLILKGVGKRVSMVLRESASGMLQTGDPPEEAEPCSSSALKLNEIIQRYIFSIFNKIVYV